MKEMSENREYEILRQYQLDKIPSEIKTQIKVFYENGFSINSINHITGVEHYLIRRIIKGSE